MISTHVLDTSLGAPAALIPVKLKRQSGEKWTEVANGVTNPDGRLSFSYEPQSGTYKIVFEVEEYLRKTTTKFFFVRIPVIFKIEDTERKYHVPLLLSPFGYSTYRGS